MVRPGPTHTHNGKGVTIHMAEKVAKVGIKKQPGYLYFIDKQGDISRAKMARGGQQRSKSRRRR